MRFRVNAIMVPDNGKFRERMAIYFAAGVVLHVYCEKFREMIT